MRQVLQNGWAIAAVMFLRSAGAVSPSRPDSERYSIPFRIAFDPVPDNRPMEETHIAAIGAGQDKEAKHIRTIDVVSAKLEAGQCEVQVPVLFIDQVAFIMAA